MIAVELPGAVLWDVTVRLGPYAAQAEPLNASADTTAPAAMARRMNLLIELSFPRSSGLDERSH
jgi:hypothetical protein